jgi:hypothetical protein
MRRTSRLPAPDTVPGPWADLSACLGKPRDGGEPGGGSSFGDDSSRGPRLLARAGRSRPAAPACRRAGVWPSVRRAVRHRPAGSPKVPRRRRRARWPGRPRRGTSLPDVLDHTRHSTRSRHDSHAATPRYSRSHLLSWSPPCAACQGGSSGLMARTARERRPCDWGRGGREQRQGHKKSAPEPPLRGRLAVRALAAGGLSSRSAWQDRGRPHRARPWLHLR